MRRYPHDLIVSVKSLRSKGKTYGEINSILDSKIPKSTLSEWCKDVVLPKNYTQKITKLNIVNLGIARATALAINEAKREKFIKQIHKINKSIARKICNKDVAKIALAMLCLGEASKYGNRTVFYLGNSDYRIIIIFLKLLKICFKNFNPQKIKCTVQCRADQDIKKLEKYWVSITGVPKSQFYKTRIDPRTIGKPTKKANYMGVLKVDYSNTKTQLELESLADLIYNRIGKGL